MMQHIFEVIYMTNKERAKLAMDAMDREYPEAACSLRSEDPLQLLIATRLSAQCTDARVNLVTPVLFSKYKTVEDFASADIDDVGEIIKFCGLYKTKSRDIVMMARMILSDFGGKVPDNMDDLLKRPGIGRKTANLILGDVFGQPSVVTDTHLIRITNRLGLVDTKDPYKVEMKLRKLLDLSRSVTFCHQIVWHGRKVCTARTPKCGECCMASFCKFATGK